jgi:hypothetical protein
VAAVRGLSTETLDMAAADDAGNFPVNSSFLILDLRSSSSSQTVEGAVVDRLDSVVPSFRALSTSGCALSTASDEGAGCRWAREERLVVRECLERVSVMVVLTSAWGRGSSGELSRLYRLRGTLTTDLEVEPAFSWRRREGSSDGFTEVVVEWLDENIGEPSCRKTGLLWYFTCSGEGVCSVAREVRVDRPSFWRGASASCRRAAATE